MAVGLMLAASIQLQELFKGVVSEIASTAGTTGLTDLATSKYIPWIFAAAVYGAIAGGAGASIYRKTPGSSGQIGHFFCGFGMGGLSYELLHIPA